MFRLIQLASQYNSVYYYESTYTGRYILTSYVNGDVKIDRVLDLLFLMVMRAAVPAYTPKDEESKTIERMTRFFAQFAVTGYVFCSLFMH